MYTMHLMDKLISHKKSEIIKSTLTHLLVGPLYTSAIKIKHFILLKQFPKAFS